jgi:hypothetical protein
MLQKSESPEHKKIRLSLVNNFKKKGWTIDHIDGEGDQTNIVENSRKIGDGKNKRPDVDATSSKTKRIIRGEAKINNGDFDSEHSITQFKLFSSLLSKSSGVSSWLIIGVPKGTKKDLSKILKENISDKNLKNITIWEC